MSKKDPGPTKITRDEVMTLEVAILHKKIQEELKLDNNIDFELLRSRSETKHAENSETIIQYVSKLAQTYLKDER
jgi:hypothetical protein